MKNVFFALIFMLISSFSFASTNVESNLDVNSEKVIELITDFNSSKELTENLSTEKSVVNSEINISIELIATTYYCSVEDGHYRGEGFGSSSAQACRRARRALRRASRQ